MFGEAVYAIHHDYEGPQLGLDWALNFGWTAFASDASAPRLMCEGPGDQMPRALSFMFATTRRPIRPATAHGDQVIPLLALPQQQEAPLDRVVRS